MRKSFVALLLLVGAAAALASTAIAREEFGGDDVGSKLVNAQIVREMRSAINSTGFSGPSSTFVGFVPGKVTPTNYWGIGKGNFRPYSSAPADYGYWGWDNDGNTVPVGADVVGVDNITEVHGDSLFGWWPLRMIMNGAGGLTLPDTDRPWWALDIGNNINYVINQGTAHKRTYGVVGVWHVDTGSLAGGGVNWAPLNGSGSSLWCGLRRDGDLTHMDPITGNPYNARGLTHNPFAGGTTGGGIGTNFLFPGYGSQWDQMAYRDINTGSDTTIDIRFRFRTNMSTGRGTANASKVGWFDKDPLEPTPGGAAAGNFISSAAAGTANAPIDSFMVYIGAPVVDSVGMASVDGSEWFLASDGSTRRVYDVQRRWFSEVLRVNEGMYTEVFTTYGNQPEAQVTLSAVNLVGITANNKARLVFRNKTNRGFDDEGGSVLGAYTSQGRGAVIIDDVEVQFNGVGGFVSLGDFESPGQVDNDPDTNPLDAWKSTGKPPAIYHHTHDATDLIYGDLCGPVGGALRICNLTGNVISAGDHDNSEQAGSLVAGTPEREPFDGFFSPTVNLANDLTNPNEMDITDDIATVTEDYYLMYDIYTGVFDFFGTGNAWRFGFAAYPASQRDGIPTWSDFRMPPFILFNPDKQCFQDQEPALAYTLLRWNSALSGAGPAYPDSMRILLQKRQECYRFGINAGCSPTDGCYWDNVSLAFVDGASPPMSIDIWQWINDSFAVNGLNRDANTLNSAEFDTTSAIIQTGLNIAQSPGGIGRYHVAGDTTAVNALGDSVRIDMIFRVSPGPGNYLTLGVKSSGLRTVPTDFVTTVDHTQGGSGGSQENNFWASYLNNNGGRGTGGNRVNGGDFTEGSATAHPVGLTNGGRDWSELVWNSARCDTAEQNFFQISGRSIAVPAPGTYATMYDEADTRFSALGIAKNRCFLALSTDAVLQANIVCNIALTDGWPYGAGYVDEIGGQPGATYEFTKIMPDGQFTPGTHVQYFMRREDYILGGGPFIAPDTSTVFPQNSEGSSDAHRWQQFSVLPDSWKKGAYLGLGKACMLYVDMNDRRGNERVWVSVADSIGATRSAKFGAHNGWHALGKVSLNDPSGYVYNLNEQPGTTWDMYGVKASESLNSKVAGLGVDYANHVPDFQITDKWSFQGPSIGMLEAFYSVILMLSGDLNSGVIGPFSNYGADDVRMLQEFMSGGTVGALNYRGVWIQGDGFVESANGNIANTGSLLNSFLYVSLVDPSYKVYTGNTDACIDLVTQSPITTNGDIYGVRNGCLFTDDVLLNGTGSVPATLYSPNGIAAPPVIAGVYHAADLTLGQYWVSLVDGWDIENLRSRFCDKSHGRLAYYYNVLTNIFGSICQITGAPPITTDAPNIDNGGVFVDFMNLKNNPLVTGRATVDFGLAKADRVEVKVFDVSGRLVRTLADRQYAPGNHSLVWDGTDNVGRQVARGVYFTQVKFVNSRFTDAKKLTVLK